MKKEIILLILFMGCLGQAPPSEIEEIHLSTGMGETFEFYENEIFLGTTTYTVEKKDVYQGIQAFFITEIVDLEAGGYSIYIDAEYIVDTTGKVLSYEFTARVNGEPQTMSARFGDTHVHETAQRTDKDLDKEIRIGEHTFTLDNNMIGQWDIMFRALQLSEESVIKINAFAAQPMTTFTVKGEVTDTVEISLNGQTYHCYKVDFSTPPYYMYVTPQGELLKLETKDGKLLIVRKE